MEGKLKNSVESFKKPRLEDEEVVENGYDQEFSEYELLQRKNIEERNKFLQSLGIKNELSQLNSEAAKVKKNPNFNKKNIILPKREPSRRIRGLAAKTVLKRKDFQILDIQKTHVDDRFEGTMGFQLEKESSGLLDNINALEDNFVYDSKIDITTCNVESFRSNLRSLRMVGPHKITDKRVQSICIHPSVSKQIVLAGCVSGLLGIWDVNRVSENDVVKLKYHKAPLNCVSVSKENHQKIYTTSHEGSVCVVDINQKQFSNLFSTDQFESKKHLTWHDEIDAHKLLIAHGNGRAGILDTREEKEKISWINCFERSCRTVQLHPVKSDYFLASSGTTGCKIFDLRSSSKCLNELPHPKGLTSAFFSPDGNSLLTTCNDDFLRIFDCSSFEHPKQTRSISHNNHTGRWLSVFKAIWFPYRNDLFMVASLLPQRMIQVYKNDGTILHRLMDNNMVTISSVLSIHPNFLFIAGGNSSGKIHAFVPPSDEI